MNRTHVSAFVCLFSWALAATSGFGAQPILAAEKPDKDSSLREAMIANARVWKKTEVAKVDLRSGPGGPGSFAIGETVACDYKDEKLSGRSPKFVCALARDDEVKVKYGGTNGEVYAEVAASRLLWALGFGADRMYPVRVVCRGCPREFGGIERTKNESVIDPAVVERKMPGTEFFEKQGWKWQEFDILGEDAAPAARRERDALTLLAVLMQHSDSKALQQRLLCLDPGAKKNSDGCRRPFMMINDLGLTFGKASRFNDNARSSMSLTDWVRTPVWKDESSEVRNGSEGTPRCVGNLPKSFTGTLEDPIISEPGRRFLAGLLVQLSDAQLHDLFDVARVQLRTRTPGDPLSGMATVAEWVDAFKMKREQIVNRRC
jgi:hypothetical protein